MFLFIHFNAIEFKKYILISTLESLIGWVIFSVYPLRVSTGDTNVINVVSLM